MKKIFLILSFLLALSCEKDFREINTDPDVFTKVEPEYLFAGVVKKTINLMAVMNKKAFWNYSHYITIEGGNLPRYSATPGDMDIWWERFYLDILSNLNQILTIYSDDPDYKNRIQIMKIWQSYIYSVMVSLWGPIPYSEAFNETQKTFKYDSEEFIYTDILNKLKEASETLTNDGDYLAPDKIFADHSIEKWKKFANSLRLKLALRISDAAPALAQPHIQELMADEDLLIQSPAEDVKAYWGIDEPNFSPYYVDYLYNRVPTETFAYLSHFLFLYLRSYNDGRIEKFVIPSIVPYQVSDTIWVKELEPVPDPNDTVAYLVQYAIPYYGRPKTRKLMDVWYITDPVPLPTSDYSYSEVNPLFFPANYFHQIISYTDVCFMKAEAALKGYGGSKTAEEYYYEGIEESFKQYGVAGKYDEYISQDGIRWETSGVGYNDFRGIVKASVDGDPLKQIAIQRWISNYFHGGHEAWCLQRRLRFLDLPPHFNPVTPTTTSENAAEIPERLPYPLSELNMNTVEVQKASDIYFGGRNDMNGYLWFAQKYEPKNWGTMTVRLNNDAVKYWYGNTFKELDSAAIEYQIIKAIKYRSID